MPIIFRIKTAGLFFFLVFLFPLVCAGETAGADSKAPACSCPLSLPETDNGNAPDKSLSFSENAKQFINEFSEKYRFDKTRLTCLFDQVEINSTAIRLMTPAGKKNRNWQAYRRKMIEPARIATGIRFWRQYEKSLELAEKQFGVPPHIIVGILGIESVYGRNTGHFRTLDTLATLAFDYPEAANQTARKAFFRQELENLLLLAHETGSDPMSWHGSYAGAIGFPQFMPGSIRQYAVDFDGDGKIDLENSAIDAIGSVANFLLQHGWKEKMPIAFPVRAAFDCAIPETLFNQGLRATFTIGQLNRQCIISDLATENGLRFGLIDLPNESLPDEYWIGTDNFFAITHYNRSYFYAMSVVLLGREIHKEIQAAINP
ncbi:lytic murein transglycosylase B [Oxalobacter paraformigenes]|uniref:Lytic murein transglycosylase B n=1 Tax=Oxalobacter paraformigenes TaxID=556268 RepID=C3X5P2_9BURK|nr:lytic murein transglycosylase B [Oxalobacter paraformigenes]EEO28528.1 lytic murein transglycosylase B [Oxalobacter paraformigenes]